MLHSEELPRLVVNIEYTISVATHNPVTNFGIFVQIFVRSVKLSQNSSYRGVLKTWMDLLKDSHDTSQSDQNLINWTSTISQFLFCFQHF